MDSQLLFGDIVMRQLMLALPRGDCRRPTHIVSCLTACERTLYTFPLPPLGVGETALVWHGNAAKRLNMAINTIMPLLDAGHCVLVHGCFGHARSLSIVIACHLRRRGNDVTLDAVLAMIPSPLRVSDMDTELFDVLCDTELLRSAAARKEEDVM